MGGMPSMPSMPSMHNSFPPHPSRQMSFFSPQSNGYTSPHPQPQGFPGHHNFRQPSIAAAQNGFAVYLPLPPQPGPSLGRDMQQHGAALDESQNNPNTSVNFPSGQGKAFSRRKYTLEGYDYVAVGSGAGGGPLAANLDRDIHKVLLLEADVDQGSDINQQVPAFHFKLTEDEKMRWDYFVKHY
ncbi:hypothetical protein GE09DRAFT_1164216 [Coniochaeta sp. 2T2.1]|nr:hypothetical protein GE09DRAFT_1164216 [Coniochaeta sp. 2T2.1]